MISKQISSSFILQKNDTFQIYNRTFKASICRYESIQNDHKDFSLRIIIKWECYELVRKLIKQPRCQLGLLRPSIPKILKIPSLRSKPR